MGAGRPALGGTCSSGCEGESGVRPPRLPFHGEAPRRDFLPRSHGAVDSVTPVRPRGGGASTLAGPFAEHLPAGNRARQPDHRRGDGEGAPPHQPHRCARADDPDRPQGSAPASTGRGPLAAALSRGGPRDDDRRGCACCFMSCCSPGLGTSGRGAGATGNGRKND
jgi:hypothetical protein